MNKTSMTTEKKNRGNKAGAGLENLSEGHPYGSTKWVDAVIPNSLVQLTPVNLAIFNKLTGFGRVFVKAAAAIIPENAVAKQGFDYIAHGIKFLGMSLSTGPTYS